MSGIPTSELRERVLTLDAEWRKQEADPQNYRYGKHVYPAKVMPADLHVLVDERAALQSRIEELERGDYLGVIEAERDRAERAEAQVLRLREALEKIANGEVEPIGFRWGYQHLARAALSEERTEP